MEPPTGFVALRDAADVVGRKVSGPSWRPIGNTVDYDAHVRDRDAFRAAYNLDADGNRVITLIAEQCEAGGIAAAYRSVTGGADSLDRSVWQLPCWRNYFATGMIDLDLPLLDEEGRPNNTARCTREVFVRRQDLDGVVATLSRPNVNPSSTVRASKKQIAAIVTRYHQTLSGDVTPSIDGLQRFAQENDLVGHREELRAEYHKQFPNQRVGRPSTK
jgi:hypothetical protein